MKRTLTILVTLVLSVCLFGCGNKETINMDNIQSKIEDLGVVVEKGETAYYLTGATSGFVLTSGTHRLEIYKYDVTSSEYKQAKATRKITIASLNLSYDLHVNNGYAYTIDDDFPKHDAVVKLLNELE